MIPLSLVEPFDFKPDKGKIEANKFLPEFFEVEKPDVLLNLGSGYGAQLVAFAPRVKTMVSLDISKQRIMQMRAVSRAYGISNNLELAGDACSLPLQPAAFDRALAIGVLHLVESPEQMAAELARTLKPGATLLVTFPTMHYVYKAFTNSAGALLRLLTGKRKVEVEADRERHTRTPFGWLALFERNGFKVAAIRASTLFPPLHWLGIPRFWVTNQAIRKLDGFLSALPVLKFLGQAAVVVFVKTG